MPQIPYGTIVAIIGYAAACCSMISFTPQAWKIIKSRETKDISAGMYAFTVTGFALWLTFGTMLAQWPIVLSNFVCLVLSAFILLMKLLPQRQKDVVADTVDPDAND